MYIYTYAITYVIHKKRDIETQTFLALPRVVGFTFGFFGNDRAAPVDAALLILCTTYIHTSRIRIGDSSGYVTPNTIIRNIDKATSHDEKR